MNFWTDTGLGKYELYFIRDKDQREVDFIVTKNQKIVTFLLSLKIGKSFLISSFTKIV